MRTRLALLALLLLAPAAPRPARAAEAADSARIAAPDVPLASRPTRPAGLRAPAKLLVDVVVDSLGRVTSARPHVRGTPALDSAAVDAARWAVFPPARGLARRSASLAVAFAPAADEALSPTDDVIPQALAAERRGDWSGACDLWVGALGRVGSHPAFANAWALSVRAILAARHLPSPPQLPLKYIRVSNTAGMRAERAFTTQASLDLLEFTKPLNASAPWFADGWRYRACAAAGAGLTAEAMRALRLWKLTAPDAATAARAEAAMAQIAAGDLIVASNALRR